MNLEVNVKEIPTQQIISITRRHTTDGLGRQQEQDIGNLFALARDYGAQTLGAPLVFTMDLSVKRRMVRWRPASLWMDASKAGTTSKSSNWKAVRRHV